MPVLATNKKANFDYKLLETFEAGLVLFGHEVKAIKDGHVSLKGAYISFRYLNSAPELFLIGAHISKYRHAGNLPDYNPIRERKILLRNREIQHLLGKKQENGLTLVPVKIYTKRSLIKMELALAEGKKKFDKREDLKKKDLDRQISTLMKRGLR
ncbi:MAG: SsrA-binding protein SmpB [Candidatus Falkowbacteria bacterium]